MLATNLKRLSIFATLVAFSAGAVTLYSLTHQTEFLSGVEPLVGKRHPLPTLQPLKARPSIAEKLPSKSPVGSARATPDDPPIAVTVKDGASPAIAWVTAISAAIAAIAAVGAAIAAFRKKGS